MCTWGDREELQTEAFCTFRYSNTQQQPWSEFESAQKRRKWTFIFFRWNGIFLHLSVLHYACGILTFKSSTSNKFNTISISILPSLREKEVLGLQTLVCLLEELLLWYFSGHQHQSNKIQISEKPQLSFFCSEIKNLSTQVCYLHLQ